MEKIRTFFNAHRKATYAVAIFVALTSGLLFTAYTHDKALDMGDGSTFYSFARNLAHGEAIYDDFIHFRTPGSYFLQALFIKIFGEQQSSVAMAIKFEIQVLYPLLYLAAVMILLRRRWNAFYILIALAGVLFLPAITQARAGFALLAVSLYIASLLSNKHQRKYLFAAGVSTGVAFIFGQETAVMAALCIFVGEVIGREHQLPWKESVKWLFIGLFAGLLPLALYLLVASNILTFLYYSLYYSFVLQPQSMNTEYPPFGRSTLIFFVPFAIYGACFFVLYMNRMLGKAEALLLSFGLLRMITALGRSDLLHLFFSIAEIFIIAPLFLSSARNVHVTKVGLLRFAPYAAAMAAIFMASIMISSSCMVLAPFVIVLAVIMRNRTKDSKQAIRWARPITIVLLAVSFASFVYLMLPHLKGTIFTLKSALTSAPSTGPRVGGMLVPPLIYKEIDEIRTIVQTKNPQTIFSFPIQAFYYSLAPHHAARFMTFEPQTTLHEQDLTIEDLERTKPEVIIFDPSQAEALSASVWKISDYILTHYQLYREVKHQNILWVMVPKAEASRNNPLVFSLYRDNLQSQGVSGVQSGEKGLVNAVFQSARTAKFTVGDVEEGDHLSVSVAYIDSTVTDDCGSVVVDYSEGEDVKQQVCVLDGMVTIPILKRDNSPVTLYLERSGDAPVVWNNIAIQGR